MAYATKAEIVSELSNINEDITQADISDLMLNSSTDYINNRMKREFVVDEEDVTMLLDGNGENIVFTERIPIVSLTSVTLIKRDESEVELTLTGSDRNVWWDEQTGYLEYRPTNECAIFLDGDEYTQTYPDRPDSIRVVGRFGEVSTDLIKYIQILLVLKKLSLMDPENYSLDLVEEKIGRYEYRKGNITGVAYPYSRKGVDAYIEWLFESFGSNVCMESI